MRRALRRSSSLEGGHVQSSGPSFSQPSYWTGPKYFSYPMFARSAKKLWEVVNVCGDST